MNFKTFSQTVDNLEQLASGWRGVVFTCLYKGVKTAIKVPNREEVEHTTEVEIENLKFLSEYDFVPKIIVEGDDFFAYEFIEGVHLSDKMKELKSENNLLIYKKLFNDILEQLYTLDEIGFFKKELIRCTKNFIVNEDNKVFMIDFERARRDVYYKNIPQYIQFLRGKQIFSLEEAIELGERYGGERVFVYEEIVKKIESVEEIR